MQTNSIYQHIYDAFSITEDELLVKEHSGSAIDHYVRFALADAKAAGLVRQPRGRGSLYSITNSGKKLSEKYTVNNYIEYAEIESEFITEYNAIKRRYEKTSSIHLHVIDDKDNILRYQHDLASRLYGAGERKRGKCRFQGGVKEIDVCWFPEEKFWWGYQITGSSERRHWNAFGFAESFNDSKTLDITCEINFSLSGGTGRVDGAFAMDESDEVYIVHSGRIGDDRKEAGRQLFIEHFAGSRQWVDVELNNKSRKMVVVSALDDDLLIQNLAYFSREVRRIKKLTVKGKRTPPPRNVYRKEFAGYRKPYSTKGKTQANVEHGKIVHSLHDKAMSMEIEVSNTQSTDLFLRKNTTAMVEVKTDDNTSSKYKAIGQLLYHSKNDNSVLIAIFPSIDGKFEAVLKRLGIIGVTCHKSGSTYEFDRKLDKVLKRL